MRRPMFLIAGVLATLASLPARAAEVKVAWKTSTDLGALAVDHAGDVVGVGTLSVEEGQFGIAKLDGVTGKSVWRVVLRKRWSPSANWEMNTTTRRSWS